MPWTEEEKQAEKERVTKIGGFRVAAQDLLAEIDPDALKARNDCWEEEYLLDLMLKAAQWGGAAEGNQSALEAWRIKQV